MHTILEKPAQVGASYPIAFTFKDELGLELPPLTLVWTLTDSDGTVINSRTDVPITTPEATTYVVLVGDDLVITGTADDGIRFVTVVGTYDSEAGTGLILKQVVEFVLMSGDPTLDAESSFNMYVTAAEMETYFFQRLSVGAFDNASRTDRLKAATMATKMIDRLNFYGAKADSDQSTEFPRGGDTAVPQDIKDACCEILLALLEDVDMNLEYDNLAIISNTYLKMKTTKDTGFVMEHIVAGIPSRLAWLLLRPYIKAPRQFNIHRVS